MASSIVTLRSSNSGHGQSHRGPRMFNNLQASSTIEGRA